MSSPDDDTYQTGEDDSYGPSIEDSYETNKDKPPLTEGESYQQSTESTTIVIHEKLDVSEIPEYIESLHLASPEHTLEIIKKLSLFAFLNRSSILSMIDYGILDILCNIMQEDLSDDLSIACSDLLSFITSKFSSSSAASVAQLQTAPLIEMAECDLLEVTSAGLDGLSTLLLSSSSIRDHILSSTFVHSLEYTLSPLSSVPQSTVADFLSSLAVVADEPDADLYNLRHLASTLRHLADSENDLISKNAVWIIHIMDERYPDWNVVKKEILPEDKNDDTEPGSFGNPTAEKADEEKPKTNEAGVAVPEPPPPNLNTLPMIEKSKTHATTAHIWEMNVRRDVTFVCPPGAKVIRDHNTITVNELSTTTVLLEMLINTGIWRLDLRYSNGGDFRSVGIAASSLSVPRNYRPGRGRDSLGYYGLNGPVRQNGQWVSGNDSWRDGDVIGIEVDLASPHHLVHFWVNGIQQPVYARKVPASLRLCFLLNLNHASVEVLSLRRLPQSEAKILTWEVALTWKF